MDFQICKKNQSLTTAEEMRKQTKLLMQPYANWEKYLTSAPLTIAILGELVFMSSNTDFSINKNPPKDGYKYIRYPDSFRACLMQVCNSSWWAFNEAYKNMDQIRLHTMAVPNYMKTAVKILFQDNDEVVEAYLPDQLENIRLIADDCLELAKSTEKRFTDVINIIGELLEACLNAEDFYTEELNYINKKLMEEKLKKESSEDVKKHTENAMKYIEQGLTEASESYKKAMDSLPSEWEMIGVNFVGGLSDSVTTLFNGIISLITHPVNLLCKATTAVSDTVHHFKSQRSAVEGVDLIIIYSKSAEILTCAENVQMFVHDNMINWKDLYDQKNKATVTDFQKDQFKRINESLEKSPNCKQKNYAQNICDKGIAICVELARYAPEGKCQEDKTKELIKRIQKLTESARSFDSTSKDVTKSPALTPKPPMLYKEESKFKKMSASQKASHNARFRIEQSRAQMDKTRESYEKSVEKMEKNQKELAEILITMRNCEVKEIGLKTTLEKLLIGMDAMGKVKEQWQNTVYFFQIVTNIVKTSLTRTLKDFVSTPIKTQGRSYNAKKFSKDQLYNQAFYATTITNLIHTISTTYTEVSTNHIMDCVSSLGKLMAMDRKKLEFQSEHLKFQNNCSAATREILHLALMHKQEFEREHDARLYNIMELHSILPAAAPEEIKSIQEAVKSGFTEEEEADYI